MEILGIYANLPEYLFLRPQRPNIFRSCQKFNVFIFWPIYNRRKKGEDKMKEVRSKITVIKDDITTQDADAIVNAANSTLLGGGGVDGAIHRAAGPELLAECTGLGGCQPGEAKTTGAYRLPAKFVIHTVGPVWRGGNSNEEKVLENAYRNSLNEAVRVGAKTVAFPAISTGVYRFPPDLAADIAVRVIISFLNGHDAIEEVRLVCFSDESVRHHKEALDKHLS